SLMKVTAFLTIATASSLFAPSAAAAAPAQTSVAARAEISGFLNQVFTFYLRIECSARRSHDRACQDCHKRAKHPLNGLFVEQRTLSGHLSQIPTTAPIEAALHREQQDAE